MGKAQPGQPPWAEGKGLRCLPRPPRRRLDATCSTPDILISRPTGRGRLDWQLATPPGPREAWMCSVLRRTGGKLVMLCGGVCGFAATKTRGMRWSLEIGNHKCDISNPLARSSPPGLQQGPQVGLPLVSPLSVNTLVVTWCLRGVELLPTGAPIPPPPEA